MCNQRRHGTSKAHQATATKQDRRERNYIDDATTAQVGRGSRRFSGMFWKASWGFKQSLSRHLRFWKFWKLSENCPITFREDSENQIQQRCTASSLQDLYRQDDGGRRSSRNELTTCVKPVLQGTIQEFCLQAEQHTVTCPTRMNCMLVRLKGFMSIAYFYIHGINA